MSCKLFLVSFALCVLATHARPERATGDADLLERGNYLENFGCATMYKDHLGSREISVMDLQEFSNLGYFNDALSSASVRNGCRLTMYEHGGFTGAKLVLDSGDHLSFPSFNDRASSVKCSCDACSASEFACLSDGTCQILLTSSSCISRRCDGLEDCQDGSDERNCATMQRRDDVWWA